MKFGPIPVAASEGSVLAHSITVGDVRLRKGRILNAIDVAAMIASDLSEVTVAQLDPDDVHEDAAAARLATALIGHGKGLRMTKASTGRVNLIAEGPGVVLLDVAALEAVNGGEPMITVATVPPFQQMTAGGMIATIKIISYAVAEEALVQSCAAARVAKAAISLSEPVIKTATLIITDIPRGVGDKGREAIATRLEALSVDLIEVVHVPHEETALAAAITAASAEIVLILTGSATSDVNDTAPAALRLAGGEVTRFGMPVDPGNLLFLGDLGPRTVIGLPGCARSPALNGADWVLSRIICGEKVSAAQIAGMGVGGLLKEIPSRPHPRRGNE